MSRVRTCAALIVAALAAGPAAAEASQTQVSIFQDDSYLIYRSTRTVDRTLGVLRALGVERVRLNVKWSYLAPRANSRRKPRGFDATNPAAYPLGVFGPYDRLVARAQRHGMSVEFNVTAPGPLWAMRRGAPDAKSGDHWYPDPREFGRFVAALGARYSGRFLAPTGVVPRVADWSIWNEPNQPGWLAPQWRKVKGRQVLNSPRLYRKYVDAAAAALYGTGHAAATDTILIGELAPEGYENPGALIATTPMPFLRALYCLDGGYRPLRGNAAKAMDCPTNGTAKAFVAANPLLFYATGFAHHPYYFFRPPAYSAPDPNFVPLANLGRLQSGLDRAFRAYGLRRSIPIYLTEYGYKTNPPNPYVAFTPAQQAEFLNQADYMAWRNPRVRSVAQFLLYDSRPNSRYKPSDFRYWSTFQTGLLFANGKPKPGYVAYRTPIWIPSPHVRRHGTMFVWGQLRPAPHDVSQVAQIQWRGARGGYKTIATVKVATGGEGYLTTIVRPPGTGTVRIAWTSARGAHFVSRAVTVRVS
jgi:hypothetical protein